MKRFLLFISNVATYYSYTRKIFHFRSGRNSHANVDFAEEIPNGRRRRNCRLLIDWFRKFCSGVKRYKIWCRFYWYVLYKMSIYHFLILNDAEFFGASSSVLDFVRLVLSASKNTLGQRNRTSRCEIFSKLGFTKTLLFLSTDAELQALQNALHYKGGIAFIT